MVAKGQKGELQLHASLFGILKRDGDMTEKLIEDHYEFLTDVFLPTYKARAAEIKKKNTRMAHYCSADTALKILSNQEFWMRDATAMNDYSELEHGIDLISKSKSREALKKALNSIYEGVVDDVDNYLREALKHIDSGTYITCFSEHSDTEESIGRLSMWRAYGGNAGVALILNNTPFIEGEGEVGLIVSPVAYLDQEDFDEKLEEVANNIRSNAKKLKQISNRDDFSVWAMHFLMLIVLCTKHKGFAEEKEWRVISVPTMNDHKGFLKSDIHTVNGIPQKIMKIPLEDRPDLSLEGISIPKFLDKIIIGPSRHPLITWRAFREKLETIGVDESYEKVFCSDIPLRSN